jgi:hypothetical protein
MKQTLKALPLAITMSLGLAANAANATTSPLDLGTLGSTITPLVVFHGAGSFNDVIEFSINKASDFSASIFNFNIANITASISAISSGNAAFSATSSVTPKVTTSPFLTSTFASLASGTYQLNISGIAGSWFGGAYGVALSAVAQPVPEPESYAMLLAGLGLMGTIARRRSKNSA